MIRFTIIGAFSFLIFVLLPAILLRLYKSQKVKFVFTDHDPDIHWTEKYPFPVLALLFLFSFGVIVLHLDIFFQSMFPLFGQLIFGRQTMQIIAFCIVTLLALIYGVFRLEQWAWWGATVYFALFTVSVVTIFSRYNFYQITRMMDLPKYEVEFLARFTILYDYNLVWLFAIPLVLVLGLLVYSRRYFVGRPVSFQPGKVS